MIVLSGLNDSLYEVNNIYSNKVELIEYRGDVKNRKFIKADSSELMNNLKTGMFFRKENGEYIFDKYVTEKIFNEMQIFKNSVYKAQQNNLCKMRTENAIYKVINLQDDCADWRTELKKLSTNEVFQELELPHNIYHQIGVGSLLKYEDGKYEVLKGTSVYDLYPKSENYCEIQGKYITKNSPSILEKINENIFVKIYNKIINTLKNVYRRIV